ncbi:MAG: hypothetical protein P4K93_12270 [Terracidiphilus sp.]|nr:hypothetical protein [Terracidiphilus sp.]
MKNLGAISLITAIVLCAGFAAAQTTQPPEASSPASQAQAPAPTHSALPDAPTPQNSPLAVYQPKANDSYNFHVGVLCGAGASTSAAATKPSTGCGVGMVLLPLPVFVEVGVMGPQAGRSNVSAYISVDESINLTKSTRKYVPMALVGYSRQFETGNALDYGIALALPRPGKPKDPSSSLRIELRDYCTFANPVQHNIQLRVGWMSLETD